MPGGETETASGGSTSSTSGSAESARSTSRSVVLDVGCLEPFNPKVEPQNLNQRWKRWKRAFDLYVTGKGVTEDAQKRALFLHVAGMDVQEIYFTLAGEQASGFAATVKNDQVNALGGKSDGRKGKNCFSCGQEGHFSGDKKCPARGRACRKCGGIGHFKVKCRQAQQRSGGDSGFRAKVPDRRGATGGGRRGGGNRGAGGGRRGRKGTRETNLVAGGNQGAEPPGFVQHSLEFAFSVGQPSGREKQIGGLVTLVVGGVNVPDVLIDSGATCNVMGQQTWDLLKLKEIKCESRKAAKELFAYRGTEPLPTLGSFTADVMLAGSNVRCRTDFVVVKGNGRTLLGRETAELLSLLRVGPSQANSVTSGQLESDIRERYKDLLLVLVF
ncbi:hypothetical protein ACROYT_G011601 [Oculina patagonica]